MRVPCQLRNRAASIAKGEAFVHKGNKKLKPRKGALGPQDVYWAGHVDA
jgi:hypothetical protein